MMVIDKQRDQPFATRLVDLVKAPDNRAVEIEHTRNLPGLDERHDQLRARSRVASDVPWKVVDVLDKNRPGPCGCNSANAFASGIRTQAGLP